jgi:hypothetical protein
MLLPSVSSCWLLRTDGKPGTSRERQASVEDVEDVDSSPKNHPPKNLKTLIEVADKSDVEMVDDDLAPALEEVKLDDDDEDGDDEDDKKKPETADAQRGKSINRQTDLVSHNFPIRTTVQRVSVTNLRIFPADSIYCDC